MPDPQTNAEWGDLLKANWERLGRSPNRDFYVASHPGWNSVEHWQAQARREAWTLLHGLAPERTRTQHMLEIGCGVGRLADPFATRFLTYTGCDIAEPMVVEARRRCQETRNARFFVSDGSSIPAAAGDRRYDFIVSHAVLIHCPLPIIRGLLGQAIDLLNDGGVLRFQLRADPADPSGIEAPPDLSGLEDVTLPDDVVTEEQQAAVADAYYMGHAFRYDEARELLAALTDHEAGVRRFDPQHVYGWVHKRIG